MAVASADDDDDDDDDADDDGDDGADDDDTANDDEDAGDDDDATASWAVDVCGKRPEVITPRAPRHQSSTAQTFRASELQDPEATESGGTQLEKLQSPGAHKSHLTPD